MLPWSVMPTAGWPSAAAFDTTSAMRAAPSSIENSVWRWRCTNDLAKVELAPLSTGLWRGLWMNHTGVVSDENLARAAAGRHEWHLHLRGRQRPVRRDQLG